MFVLCHGCGEAWAPHNGGRLVLRLSDCLRHVDGNTLHWHPKGHSKYQWQSKPGQKREPKNQTIPSMSSRVSFCDHYELEPVR